jgi:hypothetical protein
MLDTIGNATRRMGRAQSGDEIMGRRDKDRDLTGIHTQ